MPIVKEIEGNIFTADCQSLVCPVTLQGMLSRGLARKFSLRFNGLSEHYKDLCNTLELQIGQVASYRPDENGKNVILLPTRLNNDVKYPVTLKYIERSLKDLANRYDELNVESLAITPIGCGQSKFCFTREIGPLYYKILDKMTVPITVVHPRRR